MFSMEWCVTVSAILCSKLKKKFEMCFDVIANQSFWLRNDFLYGVKKVLEVCEKKSKVVRH